MMTYSIIDHGVFEIYIPDGPVGGVFMMPNMMFSRRVSDGLDWYRFSRDAANWTEGSARAITHATQDGEVIQTASADAQRLFPGNGRVIELVGVDPEVADLHELLANRICNLVTGELTDPPKPPVTKVSAAQAVTSLFNRGLLPLVESIALKHPYPPVKIFFQRANDWEIANPYVQAIALELGLDDTQLQSLFDDAAKIV